MSGQSQAKLPFSDFEKIERTFFFSRLLTEEQKQQVRALTDEGNKKVMVANFIELAACENI